MKKNWYYNNVLFRLVSPVLIGLVVYMLVLLFFDSVSQLLDNVFSREAVFVIIITVVFLEVNRLIIIILKRIIPEDSSIKLKITVQFLVSVVVSIAIISLLLNWYFIHFEGFNTITTELITFNLIYTVIAIFLNLYHFSIVFLTTRNDSKIAEESIKKANLELEMENFKYQVNPDFLFQSLEIIISELHKNKKHADELVNNLASVYRFTLDNKDEDLVLLSEEVDSLYPVLKLFNSKYADAIKYKIDVRKNSTKSLIPGTLRLLFECAVIHNIITDSIPLMFEVYTVDEQVVVKYSLNEKLQKKRLLEDRIEQLKKAYLFLSEFGIECEIINGSQIVKVPLLSYDEE